MPITDWDAWMKKNHVKIFTEEELQEKEIKARNYFDRHKDGCMPGAGLCIPFIQLICGQHASET